MRTKVWTLPIRLFHWLLAIGFTSAYILSDFDDYANLHFAFGLFVGTLLLFRIVYGWVGNKYARFNDFPMGIKSQTHFVKSYFKKDKTYIGHNPAASVVMLAIFVVGLFCSISGYLLYSVEDPSIFGITLSDDFLEETHEVLANSFLILVGMHLIGLIADLLFHSEAKSLQSMFSGYKSVEAEDSKQYSYQSLFAAIGFIVALFAFIYGYNL